MRVLRHLTSGRLAHGRRVATIGEFDAVHLGHRKLLERLVERARQLDCEAAVLLFASSARAARRRRGELPLVDLRQRLAQLTALGVSTVALVRAENVRDPGDVESATTDLLDGIGAECVLLGEALEFGATRIGGTALRDVLQAASRRPVEVVLGAEIDGRRVDCGAVRSALLQCNFASLRRMLGRSYSLAGRVVHGHHRGRQIGVPTVNLHLPGIQLPRDGVYAVRVEVEGRDLQGVANIGFKPTFGDPERTLEAHLLDFAGDLYGRRLTVRFARRIRSERKFADIDALVEQIRRDIEAVRAIQELDA